MGKALKVVRWCFAVEALVLSMGIGRACADKADRADEAPEVLKLSDLIAADDVARIEQRRAEMEVPGKVFRFTAKGIGDLGEVELYYLIEAGKLAAHPSAVIYTVTMRQYADIRKQLSRDELIILAGELKEIEKTGAALAGITLRRAVFDVGGAKPDDFLNDRQKYYDNAEGKVLFENWPEGLKKPSGRLTASIVLTTILRTPTQDENVKTVAAKQFFGYVFPLLDEVLSDGQKQKVEATLKQSNVKDGVQPVRIDGVKGLGPATLYFRVSEGKPEERPAAMMSRVTLSLKEIKDDPLILRKYLAPEGVDYWMKLVKEGERAGKRLKAVEITKLYFDIAGADDPARPALVREFKEGINKFGTREGPIEPAAWPEKFRHPDGKFDVELAPVRVIWTITKD